MLWTSIGSETSYVDDPGAWYVLHTRHQHERMVAQILTCKGFETLLPLYSASHRWKDRTKLLRLPLFPCYLFLKGGLKRRLDIMTTPGLLSIVSTGGQPAAVPPDEIEAIRCVVKGEVSVEPHPFLKCGERVIVKYGPLMGIQGILVRKKNLYRLVISVEMLGRAAAVEMDASAVERLNGKPPDVSTELHPRAGTATTGSINRTFATSSLSP